VNNKTDKSILYKLEHNQLTKHNVYIVMDVSQHLVEIISLCCVHHHHHIVILFTGIFSQTRVLREGDLIISDLAGNSGKTSALVRLSMNGRMR
jgi:hypothetical protein